MLALAALLLRSLQAQQPFITDDADTAGAHHFHYEMVNEHDFLHRSAFPALRQNTTKFQFNYGITDRLEIGIDGPLLAIFNAPEARFLLPVGIGDLNTAAKYRIHDEREGSRIPAIAIGFYVELPTGNTEKQLGSGLADYSLNAIIQKSLGSRTT
ncbi:MAG TPA: hypothetical protein VMZ52_14125, partial [Bryobacteraceae bacterium]|nr:hypothetical protein [Bryobacteraceae bacterium]